MYHVTHPPRSRTRSSLARGPLLILLGSLSLAACDSGPVEPSAAAELVAAQNGSGVQMADVMNQGGDGVYASDGAQVVRQADGLRIGVRVPTPEPGTYVYPEGVNPGHPEVFTLWAFIFNFPDLCDGPCDGNDLGEGAPAKGSVYNVGGHTASGAWTTITGRVGVGEPAVGPPHIVPTPLVNPAGAEIHLAITSHGALDPSTLPEEFRTPTGSPFCECWWVGVLLPPEA